jgi:hypothetical protein
VHASGLPIEGMERLPATLEERVIAPAEAKVKALEEHHRGRTDQTLIGNHGPNFWPVASVSKVPLNGVVIGVKRTQVRYC